MLLAIIAYIKFGVRIQPAHTLVSYPPSPPATTLNTYILTSREVILDSHLKVNFHLMSSLLFKITLHRQPIS